jgi:Arc/MetJ-type ribon-helix-helix transcriptional regulator
MEEKQETTYWNVPVPKALDEALEQAIRQNWHRTKAEFIRELVRRELEKRGFHPQEAQNAQNGC